MKREFPLLYARISNWVATPLIIITAMFYIEHAIEKPASEFVPLGSSVFGLTVGLAALCFTMTPATRAEHMVAALRYAGEKYFHSSLLMIQILILVFVRESLLDIGWIASSGFLSLLLKGLLHAFALLVGSTAAWSWYWAFDRPNTELWLNWEYRIKEINQ